MPRRKRDRIEYKLKRIGKIWYVCWSENRVPKRRSTWTGDEAAANAYLVNFIQGREEPELEGKTVNAAIDSYLKHKKQESRTVQALRNYDNYEHSLRRVKASTLGKLPIASVTRGAVREYTVQARNDSLKDGTIRKGLTLMVAALNHVRKEGWIDTIPHIDKPEDSPARQNVLTEKQVKKLIGSAKESHVRLFIMLAAYTLSRKQAILDLTWDRVDLKNKLIDFNMPDTPQNSKRRIKIPIFSDVLYNALKEAYEVSTTDYVIEYGGSAPLFTVRLGFKAACRRAKIEATPHVLRHTGASLLVSRGMSLEKVAKLLGDTIKTTEKNYVHLAPDYMKETGEELARIYG